MFRTIFLLSFITFIQCNEEQIIRPCPDNSKYEDYLTCISKYFAAHSECNPNVKGLQGEQVEVLPMVAELPASNRTLRRFNEKWNGLQEAIIHDFYINVNTNNAVLTVALPTFKTAANVTRLYHNVGEEDTIIEFYHIGEFKDVITTTVIANKNGLDYPNSVTYGYISEVVSLQSITEETDPAKLAKIQPSADNSVAVQELFLVLSPRILDVYLNNVICYFQPSSSNDA